MEPKEFETLLSDAETRLDRLKALYEQYFQGFERLEPSIPRKDFERRIQALRREQPRNTALRFRFHTLLQRYTTFQTYWNRVARQIEEGTYRRDLMRARKRREDMRAERRAQRDHDAEQRAHELDLDIEVNVDELMRDAESSVKPASVPPPPPPKPGSARPSSPPRALSPFAHHGARPASSKSPAREPAAARPTPPAASSKSADGSASDAHIRKIYDQYVDARRRNNERVDNVRYEKVAKSIRDMMPKLEQKYRGKKIDFEVVVKDGRVGLKPKVK